MCQFFAEALRIKYEPSFLSRDQYSTTLSKQCNLYEHSFLCGEVRMTRLPPHRCHKEHTRVRVGCAWHRPAPLEATGNYQNTALISNVHGEIWSVLQPALLPISAPCSTRFCLRLPKSLAASIPGHCMATEAAMRPCILIPHSCLLFLPAALSSV